MKEDKLNGKGEVIYPYFFFNINEIGLMGVGKWILILLIAFIVIGYLIYFLDKIIKKYK